MQANPRKDAFSLVEVVLALGIVAVGFVALLGLLPVGVQGVAASRFETEANHLARAVIAELQTVPFKSHPFYGQSVDLLTFNEATPPLRYYATLGGVKEPLFVPASADPTSSERPLPERPVWMELRFRGLETSGERLANQVFVKIAFPGVGEFHYGTILGRH